MQRTDIKQLDATVLNKYVEFDCREATKCRITADLIQPGTWGTTALQVWGSVTDVKQGGAFYQIAALGTISAEGITTELDVGSVRRLRVVVSATNAGTRLNIGICLSNPNFPDPTPAAPARRI